MTDFATLVLAADTRQMTQAERAIDGVTKSGARAERATDALGKGFDESGRKATGAVKGYDSAGRSLKNVIGVAARVAGVLATAFSARAVVQGISEFESSMSRVGALSGATGNELIKLRNIAKDLGSTTEFSAAQAADGLSFLAMAGFNAAESMAAIPAVLDLATAASMDLAQAADIASNIMSGFGIAASEAASLTDVLAAASSRSNTSVAQLGAAMSTVAPISAALGISVQDTAAAIGIMSDAGIQGERAGTALRGVLASLSGPTTQAQEALAKYGMTAADVNPETRALANIMGDLQTAGLSTADAMTIFGREAASGALVLAGASGQVRDFGNELRNADGAAAEMAKTMRDNLGGDIKGLQSAIAGLIIALGDAGLTDAIRSLVQMMTTAFRFISENLIEALNTLGVVIVGLAATQVPALVTALKAKVLALGAATTATGVLTLAMRGLAVATAIAGGPLGVLAALVAGSAAYFLLFRDNGKEAASGAEDAQIASDELNRALGTFYQTAAPEAGKLAIELANNNYELANAAYAAAEAEVAKRKAILEAAEAAASETMDPYGQLITGPAADEALVRYRNALQALAETEKRLADARNRQRNAATAVTGAMSDEMTEANNAAAELSVTLDVVTKGLGDGGLSGGASAATDAAEKLAKELDGPLSSAIDGVAGAFGDWIAGGLSDFKSFTKSILDSFKRMLSQMIATAIANPIKIALGIGGSLAGTAASAGGAGLIGSAGAGLAGIGSNLGAAATTALGLGGTFTGSFGAGLGATMTGGLAGGAGAFSTGIGMMGTAATAGSGAAMAIGAAVPVIGTVVAGLTLLSSIGAKRAAKRLEAATNANNAKLEKVEQENNARNAELATRLRENVDATEALIQSMQTLAQMEQERQQAARAILAERANLEIELLRLQNDTVALREREIEATEPVNRQLRRFILAMGDAAEAIEAQRRAVEGLASAGGGVVDFVRGIRNQAALSFREDLALAQGGDIAASGRITGSAQSAIDQARAGARTGVELDRFIAQTAASLMALPAVATFEEQQIALLEEISSGIGDLTSLQDDTQRKLIKAIGDGFFVIDKNLDGKLTFDELKAGLGGIATDAELRQIFNTLDKNGDGTIDRLEYLTNSNDGIEDNTGEAWLASQNQLSELKIIAGETANNTERVKELTTAIETLVFSQKVASQQQLANLEAQRTAARRTLKNAQRALSGTPSTVVLQSAKKGFLGIGRRPEIRGANPTYVALQEDIRRATEELAALEAQINNIPRFAAGGAHMGGVRMVGERGPELEVTGRSQIHSNASTMEMLSNAPVVSELKNLRRELAAMRDEQRQLGIQTARNTERTYRVLREFDVIGLPPERTT
jgi:TP901 family phage tail tape measure protein